MPTWWSAFNDPQLDRLMQQALADNPSLAQAMARVREAQSLADVARAGLAPSLSFNAQETRQRFSGHDVIPPPYAGTKRWQGHEGLNLSWDIDFWGRQDSLLKQARSRATAAALDVASARLALSGAVAQAYIDLYRNKPWPMSRNVPRRNASASSRSLAGECGQVSILMWSCARLRGRARGTC